MVYADALEAHYWRRCVLLACSPHCRVALEARMLHAIYWYVIFIIVQLKVTHYWTCVCAKYLYIVWASCIERIPAILTKSSLFREVTRATVVKLIISQQRKETLFMMP